MKKHENLKSKMLMDILNLEKVNLKRNVPLQLRDLDFRSKCVSKNTISNIKCITFLLISRKLLI